MTDSVNSLRLFLDGFAARDLVERKRAAMNGLSRDVRYRRLAGMLSRRGFDASITARVLADVLSE